MRRRQMQAEAELLPARHVTASRILSEVRTKPQYFPQPGRIYPALTIFTSSDHKTPRRWPALALKIFEMRYPTWIDPTESCDTAV